MVEIWKDIDGYEGCYQVSNLGNVKSLKFGKERIMKTRKDKGGYLKVILSLFGKKTNYSVHRLVASTFIPNPDNLPCVNHKDECKTNNNVDNLEWCSYQYNNTYGNRIKLAIESQKNNPSYKEIVTKRRISNMNNPKTSKKVLCVETGIIYPSTKETQRILGINNSGVCAVCLGRCKTYKGFHWRYID